MDKWNKYVLAAVAAAVIYFGGLPGLIIGASILVYLAIIASVLPILIAGQEKLQAIERRLESTGEVDGGESSFSLPEPAGKLDGEEFSFSLPDPAPNGWEAYTFYPSRQRYQREYCFGGPPAHNETWQYEVKDSQVFHRLIDANEAYFGDPVWEVINGTISEDGVARNTSEPHVREQIERHRQAVEWHECIGSLSFEILAIHFRSQPYEARVIFARKQERFKAAFIEIEKQLVTMGAVEKEYGDGSFFIAPDGASEDLKKQINDFQANAPGKSRYSDASGITFYEFIQRKKILGTLSRLLLQLQQAGIEIKSRLSGESWVRFA